MNERRTWEGPAAAAAFDQNLAEVVDIVRQSKGPLIVCGLDEEDRLMMCTLINGSSEADVFFTLAGLSELVMRRLVEMLNETIGPQLTSIILSNVCAFREENRDA